MINIHRGLRFSNSTPQRTRLPKTCVTIVLYKIWIHLKCIIVTLLSDAKKKKSKVHFFINPEMISQCHLNNRKKRHPDPLNSSCNNIDIISTRFPVLVHYQRRLVSLWSYLQRYLTQIHKNNREPLNSEITNAAILNIYLFFLFLYWNVVHDNIDHNDDSIHTSLSLSSSHHSPLLFTLIRKQNSLQNHQNNFLVMISDINYDNLNFDDNLVVSEQTISWRIQLELFRLLDIQINKGCIRIRRYQLYDRDLNVSEAKFCVDMNGKMSRWYYPRTFIEYFDNHYVPRCKEKQLTLGHLLTIPDLLTYIQEYLFDI